MKRYEIRETRLHIYIYDTENGESVALTDAGVIAEVICQALNDYNDKEHI